MGLSEFDRKTGIVEAGQYPQSTNTTARQVPPGKRKPRRWLGALLLVEGLCILTVLAIGGYLLYRSSQGAQPQPSRTPDILYTASAPPQVSVSAAPPSPTSTTGIPTPTLTQMPLMLPSSTPAEFRMPERTVSPGNANALAELAHWGLGQVQKIAWSPDGRWLAVPSNFGIHLYDAVTLKEVRFIEADLSGEETRLFSAGVAFSPDGNYLASASNSLALWEVATGRLLWTQTANTGGQLAFSPDGSLLVTRGVEYSDLNFWEASTGTKLRKIPGDFSYLYDLAFSPDGQLLAAATWDSVQAWNSATGIPAYTVDQPGGAECLAFSPDGKALATCGLEGILRLWHADTGKFLRTFGLVPIEVIEAVFSPDSQTIATGSDTGRVQLWDAKSGAKRLDTEGHSTHAFSLAYRPDGRALASAGNDGRVNIWDAGSGARLQTIDGFTFELTSVAFSPDGELLLARDWANTQIWDPKSRALLRIIPGDQPGSRALAVSRSGSLFATGTDKARIQVWDLRTGTLQETLGSYTDPGDGLAGVVSIAINPDEHSLAYSLEYYILEIWDLTSGKRLADLKGHYGTIVALDYSPDGQTLASASVDGTIKLWNAHSGDLLRTITGVSTEVKCLAFSPDGSTLASGAGDKSIRIWNVSSGTLQTTLKTEKTVTVIAFSPDGSLLVSGGEGSMNLWDFASSSLLRTIDVPHLAGLAFSPDGRVLVSASFNGSLQMWGILP